MRLCFLSSLKRIRTTEKEKAKILFSSKTKHSFSSCSAMSRENKLEQGLGVVLERVEGDDGAGRKPFRGFVHDLVGRGLEVLFEKEKGAVFEQDDLQGDHLSLGLGQLETIRVVGSLVSSVGLGELFNQASHLVAVEQDFFRHLAVVEPESSSAFTRSRLFVLGAVGLSGRGSLMGGRLCQLHVAVGQFEAETHVGFCINSSRGFSRMVVHGASTWMLKSLHVVASGAAEKLISNALLLLFLYLLFLEKKDDCRKSFFLKETFLFFFFHPTPTIILMNKKKIFPFFLEQKF